MIVDSHQHYWTYNAGEYAWIGDEMAAIRRDFGPAELAVEIERAGVDGVVTVQARQTLAETAWLLDLAAAHAFMRGVVGWVPLAHPAVTDDLARLAGGTKLRAVRHVVQGEADEFLERADFNRGVSRLREFRLAYDILIVERQLPAAIRFVDRHPDQVFVLDHLAKPRLRERVLSPWRENIRELARRENVYGKLSGLVTEADFRAWSEDQLRPYMETALEAFGPRRLMFGSDWPVCLVACAYGRWREIVTRLAAPLSEHERSRIMGGTAVEAYRLS